MTGWLSSFAAMQRLREAGAVDPASMLTQLAEARQLRARASWGRFAHDDGGDREFPQEPEVDALSGEVLPWPDIPADFWRWVNGSGVGTEVRGEAGVFAATVIYDPQIGHYSDSEHIKLFGVTFHEDDLEAALRGKSALRKTPALSVSTRSPAGRKPELERWAEFGAALAFVVNRGEKDTFKSQAALYAAAAGELTAASREPLAHKTVKNMVSQAFLWIEGEAIPPLPPEA